MIKPLIGIVVVLLISLPLALAGSQASVSNGSLPLFFLCASVGFILHWLMFIPAYIYQTEHYFDLTGSLSYIAAISMAIISHPGLDLRGTIIALFILIWAARLGSFLFMRVKRDGKDSRFDVIKTKFFRYLFTWTLGGAWVFITMAAGLAAITSAIQIKIGIVFYLGAALWLSGFAVEVVADRQKSIFRSNPDNKSKFISSGLWSVSRHPNYFGEIVLWIGISVMAFPALSGWQFATLISPIFVIFLLIKVSGVRLLEESGQERWGENEDYRKYVERTPVLIPAIRRR
jgi:steroid 5-alpha reductase family enzyme